MSHARVDDWVGLDSSLPSLENLNGDSSAAIEFNKFVPRVRARVSSSGPRRTPRVSLILVLPDDQVVDPDRLAQRLSADPDVDVHVTIACAGQPTNLDVLKRTVRSARFLLAPEGTTAEDLRELAMEQTPGDIVTLLNVALLCSPSERDHVVAS